MLLLLAKARKLTGPSVWMSSLPTWPSVVHSTLVTRTYDDGWGSPAAGHEPAVGVAWNGRSSDSVGRACTHEAIATVRIRKSSSRVRNVAGPLYCLVLM